MRYGSGWIIRLDKSMRESLSYKPNSGSYISANGLWKFRESKAKAIEKSM